MKKRNISIISNQGTDSTELFKEYFDLLKIICNNNLKSDKKNLHSTQSKNVHTINSILV